MIVKSVNIFCCGADRLNPWPHPQPMHLSDRAAGWDFPNFFGRRGGRFALLLLPLALSRKRGAWGSICESYPGANCLLTPFGIYGFQNQKEKMASQNGSFGKLQEILNETEIHFMAR